jgi:hypothetical protein
MQRQGISVRNNEIIIFNLLTYNYVTNKQNSFRHAWGIVNFSLL